MIYLSLINLFAFAIMGIDKYKAIHDHYRISEAFLLSVAIVGGVYGEMLGMYFFHHKTQKLKFKIGLPIIAIIFLVFMSV